MDIHVIMAGGSQIMAECSHFCKEYDLAILDYPEIGSLYTVASLQESIHPSEDLCIAGQSGNSTKLFSSFGESTSSISSEESVVDQSGNFRDSLPARNCTAASAMVLIMG